MQDHYCMLHFYATLIELPQQKHVLDDKNLAKLWMIKPSTFAESKPQ